MVRKYKFIGLVSLPIFGRAVMFLLLQQLMVASSSLWLVEVITSVQGASDPLVWLGIYMASLLLPYLPGAASLVVLERAQAQLAVTFAQRFRDCWMGQVLYWSNKAQHGGVNALLTGEAAQALQSHLSYLYHVLSCALNVLLNILVIALIIDEAYLGSFGIGVVLAAMVLWLQRQRKEILALQAQQARLKWTEAMLSLWDNVLLNNRHNFKIWGGLFSKSGQALLTTAVGFERYSQMVSLCMVFVLFVPTILLVFILMLHNRQDPTFMGVIAVTLPRLFQIITYAYELLFFVAALPAQNARVRTILASIEPPAAEPIEGRIYWQRLKCTRPDGSACDPGALLVAPPQPGRYTLRGANGSGKTTFLLLLKQRYADEAFFLPAQHALLFETATADMSTGQRVSAQLKELGGADAVGMLLLDEWDANLDDTAVEQFSSQIDELSRCCCVVEARHRS